MCSHEEWHKILGTILLLAIVVFSIAVMKLSIDNAAYVILFIPIGAVAFAIFLLLNRLPTLQSKPRRTIRRAVDDGIWDRFEIHVATNITQAALLFSFFGVLSRYIPDAEMKIWAFLCIITLLPHCLLIWLSLLTLEEKDLHDYLDKDNCLMKCDIYVDVWSFFATTTLAGCFDYTTGGAGVLARIIFTIILNAVSLWDILILKGAQKTLEAFFIAFAPEHNTDEVVGPPVYTSIA